MSGRGSIEWVCHQWARNQGLIARARHGQVFCEGRSLWSWGHHYELGRIIEHDGKPLVLINVSGANQGGSVSTGNHRRYARHKARAVGPVLEVTDMKFNAQDECDRHVANAHARVAQAARSRTYAAYALESALFSLSMAKTFEPYGAKVPAFTPDPKAMAKLTQRAVKLAVTNDDTRLLNAVRALTEGKDHA